MRETKTKHTPGPWKVATHEIDYERIDIVQAEDGTAVCFEPIEITFTGCPTCGPDFSIDPFGQAGNMRLIAAAPELLSVAEAIAAKGSGCEDCQECRAGDIWWDARAAIAKATGGES